MPTHYEHRAAVTLVGLSTRTTNENEAGPNGRLPELWNNYMESNLLSQLKAANPHLLYALYTDYESDHSGAYTVILGHEHDASTDNAGEGLKLCSAPESNYMVFVTRQGPAHQVVVEAWQEIWAYFEDAAEKRSYTGDYELYDTRNWNSEQAVVHIYIALMN